MELLRLKKLFCLKINKKKENPLTNHLEKQANSGQLFTMNYSPCSIGTKRSWNAKLGVNQDAISHSFCLALPLTLL